MLEEHGKYYVLHIEINDEENSLEWVESEGVLSKLTPLREQLLQGDMRMLYLAWLRMISLNDPEEYEDGPEPPVPPGLKKLNASLQAFTVFLEIDPHLISAAAQTSEQAASTPEPDLESGLAKLTREESNAYLLKILHGEPGAVLSLKKRLAGLSGAKTSAQSQSTRTASELFEQAKKLKWK